MAESSPERRFTRIDRLPPYVFNITAELKMAARRRGEDIIDFSMGNPDGATPPHIVERLCTVAQRPDTHGYSTSRGIPRLRRAISRWYEERYNVDIDPESEAIVTIGSKEGLAHLMLATLDHGDNVLVPKPSYPIHIYGAVIAGAQVRSVPLVEGVDFFNELERAIRESYPKPKMMILGFPSNPTAQCVELDFFEKVVALAKQYDILVVHDLAYADIVYDGWKAPSIMQVPGAREEAQRGFPHITALALPQLQQSRARGASEPQARLDALMAIMTPLSDTSVLSRAGMSGLQTMQQGAREVLAAGGCASVAGRAALARLDAQMLAHNASPGGAADLLAATLFLDRVAG
ncbi:Glutamate-pyruvate aminotransferase AlaC [Klebsiella quasipneumoniae subsp. similipneumoniae]|nr:Glutamate-pyruvate aminotransferase AlaC [Klebsiella quasipneumoniae subsp. similipneumoniae]